LGEKKTRQRLAEKRKKERGHVPIMFKGRKPVSSLLEGGEREESFRASGKDF